MIGKITTIFVDELEKITPIAKAVFVDVHPQVVRSGRANVEPKRCGPNVLLWTGVEANLEAIGGSISEESQVGRSDGRIDWSAWTVLVLCSGQREAM